MSKPNAVKFKVIVDKSRLKEIVVAAFDLDIQLKYPNLANAENKVPVRGVCLLGSFEQFVDVVTPKDLNFLDRLKFQQNVNFKLVEIEVLPVELPTGAEKEVSQKTSKK